MSDPDTSSAPSPPHEIIVIPPPGHQRRRQLLDHCLNVRTDVFVHEQRFAPDVDVDGQDPTATHFLLRLVPTFTPIGTVRTYRVEETNCYKLSRLAVLKPYRKYRFGRDLVLALHQWIKQDAVSNGLRAAQVVCHSQLPVKDFYTKYGYQPEGGEFDEDGTPHQKMVAYLSW